MWFGLGHCHRGGVVVTRHERVEELRKAARAWIEAADEVHLLGKLSEIDRASLSKINVAVTVIVTDRPLERQEP
jgi:hypothetical protein